MKRRFPTSDSLIGLSNVVMGASISAASLAAGLALPSGAAQLAFGASGLLGSLGDQRRKETARVFARLRKRLERDWQDWSGLDDGIEDGLRASVLASLDTVLPLIHLTPQEVTSCRLDPDDLAALMLSKAETALPSIYGPGVVGTRDGDLARQVLSGLSRQAFAFLLTDPAFTGALAPRLWGETLGMLDSLAAGQEDQTQRLARIEGLLAEALDSNATAQRARDNGVTETALIALATRIAADVDTADQALRELENAVDIALAAQQGDTRSDPVMSAIAAASAEGDHLGATARIEDELARQEAAHTARTLALLEAGLEQDLLRRDVNAAAARLIRIEDLRQGGQADFPALRALAISWFGTGRDKGLVLDLDIAAALARDLTQRAAGAEDHGAALNVLGVIEHTRGERAAGPRHLLAAVAAFEEALMTWTRDGQPALWAKAQMNLANSLLALAQREPGNDRLSRAIEAYGAALEVRTRSEMPAEWAMTRMNMAIALRLMAETDHQAGPAVQSLTALDQALEVRHRDADPLQWAITLLNRAITLRVLAELQADGSRVAAARQDLETAATTFAELGADHFRAQAALQTGMLHLADLATGAPEPPALHAARSNLVEAAGLFADQGATADQCLAEGHDALIDVRLGQVTRQTPREDAGRDRVNRAILTLQEIGHRRGAAALSEAYRRVTEPEPAAQQGTADR